MNTKTTSIMIIITTGAIAITASIKTTLNSVEQGYYEDPYTEMCIRTEVKCELMGYQICSYFNGTTAYPLKRFVNGTQCGIHLYKAD